MNIAQITKSSKSTYLRWLMKSVIPKYILAQPLLPYSMTLPAIDPHLLLSSAVCLASKKLRPGYWMTLSLDDLLGLPHNSLPFTMPSIRLRRKESCFMMCLKNDIFLIRTVSDNDLQIVTPLQLFQVLSSYFFAFASVSISKGSYALRRYFTGTCLNPIKHC